MNLSELIQSLPSWQSKTAQDIFDELTEPLSEPDPTPYTFAALGETLGSSTRTLVSYTMLRIATGELLLPEGYEAVRADIDTARIAMFLPLLSDGVISAIIVIASLLINQIRDIINGILLMGYY